MIKWYLLDLIVSLTVITSEDDVTEDLTDVLINLKRGTTFKVQREV